MGQEVELALLAEKKKKKRKMKAGSFNGWAYRK